MELTKDNWKEELNSFIREQQGQTTFTKKDRIMLIVCFVVSLIQAGVWILFFMLGLML